MDLSVAYTQSLICINYDSLVEENYKNLYSPRLQCQASLCPLDSHPQQGPLRARHSNEALRIVNSTCELALLCRNNQSNLILVTATRLLTKSKVCCLPTKQMQHRRSCLLNPLYPPMPRSSELNFTDLRLRFSKVIHLC